jgi:hypothetical protein
MVTIYQGGPKSRRIVGYAESSDIPENYSQRQDWLKQFYGPGRFELWYYSQNKRAPVRDYVLVKNERGEPATEKQGLGMQEWELIREALNNNTDRILNQINQREQKLERKLDEISNKLDALEDQLQSEDKESDQDMQQVMSQINNLQSMMGGKKQ